MFDVDVLDHIVIGQGRFTSVKAKKLGFDQVYYGKRKRKASPVGGK
jgi:hypothetical protein